VDGAADVEQDAVVRMEADGQGKEDLTRWREARLQQLQQAGEERIVIGARQCHEGQHVAHDLAQAIREGSIEQLVRIPGVGKKTAERMVLELRDKLDLLPGIARGGAAPAKSMFNTVEEDVISALANFGVSRVAAEAAVTKARSASEGNDFDGLFRRALKLVR